MNNKCTVLVNSCDDYSDVWELFFKALHVQWPTCKFPILLNTETKQYPNDYGVQVINYKPHRKDCWGARLKNALRTITTPYVIPILDDIVFKEKFTGDELISKAVKWLDDNPDIGVFYFYKHPYLSQEKTEFEGFGLLPQKAEYKLTTAIGVWRREYFDKCVRGFETPWEWEVDVTRKAWKYKERMYALLETQEEPYKYTFGGVVWRGLWHPEVKELAEKYDVKIDFSKRGFMDETDPYRIKNVYPIRKNFPKDICKLIFWREVFSPHRIKNKIRSFLCRI